jgi:uncharacterized protein YecT (DUF1311 family)
MIFALLLTLSQVVASNPYEEADIAFCNSDERKWQTGYVCMAEQEYDRANKRLNEQWAKSFQFVRQHRGHSAASQLRQKQRGWIRSTDAHCQAESAPTPSTQQGRNYLTCLQIQTEKRTSELQAIMRQN